MFVLVLFTDNIISICSSSDISALKKKCPAVKYTDGKKYTARILALYEDSLVLQEIQKNLEDEIPVIGRIILSTGKKLSYSNILKKHQNCHDDSKLYLDASILPLSSTNSKELIFSLGDHEEEKHFFAIQTDFVEHEITQIEEAVLGDNLVKPAMGHVCTEKILDEKFSIDHQTCDKKNSLNDVCTNQVLRKKNSIDHQTGRQKNSIDHQTGGQKNEMENKCPDLMKIEKNAAIQSNCDEKNKMKHVCTDPIFGERNLNDLVIFYGENTMEHVLPANILDANNLIDKPTSAKENDMEHASTEQDFDGENSINHQIFIERDAPQCASTNQILGASDKRNRNDGDETLTETTNENSITKMITDQSTKKVDNLLENDYEIGRMIIDKNCNFSVFGNLNEVFNDLPVPSLPVLQKMQPNIKQSLAEHDPPKYMDETLTSENHKSLIYEAFFPSLKQKESDEDSENLFLNESQPMHQVATDTYNLDLSTLELLGAGDNSLDEPQKVCKPKPRMIFDTRLTENIKLDENFNFSLLDNSTMLPDSNSTALNESNKVPTVLDTYTTSSSCDEARNDSGSSADASNEVYNPSETEASSDSSTTTDVSSKKSKKKQEQPEKCNASLNITLGINKPGSSAPDDADLRVVNSKAKGAVKKHFCVYCQKFQSKFARHLEFVHKDEDDVKQFVHLEPKHEQRLKIIATIRKRGNNLYNTDRRFNRGGLLVVRRPQKRMHKTAKDFIACGNCKGQYSRSVIRHHFKKCTQEVSTKERLVMVKGRMVSARVHEAANELVRKNIFPYMREDEVVRMIRYDKLIIQYANKQCEKYGTHQHLYQMIRARLRYLGRFMLAIREINSHVQSFAEVFQPRNYDIAVDAVKKVAGWSNETLTFAHPNVASCLGTLLKHSGEILRSECIKEERAYDQKRVEDFLKLQSENYGASINRAVLETVSQNNRRKKVVLPSLDDITKLHNYLKSERNRHLAELKKQFSAEHWRKLAEVTLTSLQVFYRRRAGEIERFYIEDFKSYQGIDSVADKDTYKSLSQEGQSIAKKYVRFMIRGKRGRGVPVLVPKDILDCLLLIIKYRSDAGVSERNMHLFRLPSKDKDRFKYLRACDLMRRFSQQCGADFPDALRETQLRKHVATKCISLDSDQNQVSDLANFMGHAEKIHREIYRQPVIQNDIIKIFQLLEIAQGTDRSSPNNDESSTDDEVNIKSAVRTANFTSGETSGNEDSFASFSRAGTSKRASNVSVNRRRWTEQERETVLGAFKTMIEKGKMPTGAQLQQIINDHDCLKGRQVAQLRTWLHGQKNKL